MMIDITRHKMVFNPETFTETVHIIGCGGMGSRVAEGLVRMGVGQRQTIHLYDHDTFEAHNVANQWVDEDCVFHDKVEYVRAAMRRVNSHCRVDTHKVRLTNSAILSGVIFLCVDSMTAREQIMENAIETSRRVTCVIEARMDAETGVSFCFNPHNKHQNACWWMHWYPSEEAANFGGCSEPQSIHSAIIGTTAMALKQFEQYARIGATTNMLNHLYQDFNTIQIYARDWGVLD